MKIAMVAARFHAGEANELRAPWRPSAGAAPSACSRRRWSRRMVARGYDRDFAERCFNQIKGFGEYGFPESHAASFALLVYVSSWLKCHYPAAFCARAAQLPADGLLRPGPDRARRPRARRRGARAPTSIIQRLGVQLLETGGSDRRRRRCGSACARSTGWPRKTPKRCSSLPGRVRRFSDVQRSAGMRAGLPRSPTLERLAAADAFRSLGLDRRQALWEVKALATAPRCRCLPGCRDARRRGPSPTVAAARDAARRARRQRLPDAAAVAQGAPDELPARSASGGSASSRARSCAAITDGACVAVAGVVLVRQRPGYGQGRRLHDARGRDRHRQHRRLAEDAGALPQGGDGRAPHPHPGAHPAARGHHPRRLEESRGSQRLARAC